MSGRAVRHTARVVAELYDDHPDYKGAWRPL
jgi:hypothetical protein